MSCGIARVSTKWERPSCENSVMKNCRKVATFGFQKSNCPEETNDWVDFPLTVTTLPPETSTVEIPTNTDTKARYYLSGNKMTIQYSFINPTPTESGNDGLGSYFLRLPSGFNYDSENYIAGVGHMVFIPTTGLYYSTVDIIKSLDGVDYVHIGDWNGIIPGFSTSQLEFGSTQTPITTDGLQWYVIIEVAVF